MSAAGLPTIVVSLDDGSGTFPYDITSYARLRDGYTITRGRSNELANVEPGTLTLTLDNTDGRFTLGSGTYGVHVDQQIRVSVTVGASTSNRFTGFVQSWPVGWPDGSEAFSTVVVTAVDVSARWSRRSLGTLIGETVLPDSPLVYYTLGEPSGAVAASDSSGNGGPPLVQTGTGTDVVFGSATGPGTDGLTAAQFTSGGKKLAGSLSAPPTLAAASIEFFVTGATVLPTIQFGELFGGGVAMGVDAGGIAAVDGNTSLTPVPLPSVSDGLTHHICVTVSTVAGVGTMAVYKDGVFVVTAASTGILTAAALPAKLSVGGNTSALSHVAVYNTVLSPTRIAAHAAAGLTGFVETSDLRIDRLIGYEGTLTTTAGDTGQVTVPTTDIAGKTVTDAVQQVVDAEVGLLWINGTGQATYANKDHVALAKTPAMTIPINSGLVEDGVTFSVDMQQVTNHVVGQREGDDGTQVVTDPTSITAHGTYATSETWLVQTDTEVLSRAQWLVTKYAEPSPRLPTLGLDLLTAESADQIAAIGLDLTSHIKITGWPSQAPAADTDLVVEGYTETLSDNAWELSLNCASWTQQAAFILDDTTYGVLDTSTLGI